MILYKRNLKVVVNTNAHKYTFTDLYMDFSAEADRDKKPNESNVTIYNLSRKTRDVFVNDFRSLEIYAGYGDTDPPMVSIGSITSIYNEPSGVNYATTIQALDGGKQYFDTIYNKSFSKGTPVEIVLLDVISAMGLVFENSAFIYETLLSSMTYSGKVKDVLSQVCEDFNLKWNIQREVVQVYNKGETPLSSQKSVVLLSADTGLIGTPIVKEDGTILVKSLMNAEIRPNRIIKLMPTNPVSLVGFQMKKKRLGKKIDLVSEGFFVVDKVKYSGSNYGSSYELEAECKVK